MEATVIFALTFLWKQRRNRSKAGRTIRELRSLILAHLSKLEIGSIDTHVWFSPDQTTMMGPIQFGH